MTGMKETYATTGKIFAEVSMRKQPGLYEQIKAVAPNDIIVVKGVHDHVETLLDALKVPYKMIDQSDVKNQNGGRVLIYNCKGYDNGVPVKATQEFVNEGGRLVTTDWALGVVTKSFPGKLKKIGKTSDDVVEVRAATDTARTMIGLEYAQCRPQWWLEGSSDVYEVTADPSVVPLIVSEEMKSKYGSDKVAVGFPVGKGEVVHFISHLELQRTRLKEKYHKGSIDDFLLKMGVEGLASVVAQAGGEGTVAEFEAAYSTLNTLAHLCVPMPIVNYTVNSVMTQPTNTGDSNAMTSMRLD